MKAMALLPAAFTRLDTLELKLCRPANAAARQPQLRLYFSVASRLGDGIVWYLLLALLPVAKGPAALSASLQMALTGIAGVLIYRALKGRLVRERPYRTHCELRAVVAALDRYSFPSGHTLHAVCFSVMLSHHWPELTLLLMPLAASIAVSRVVLGLHYPSDVVAGAAIGWGLAAGSLGMIA